MHEPAHGVRACGRGEYGISFQTIKRRLRFKEKIHWANATASPSLGGQLPLGAAPASPDAGRNGEPRENSAQTIRQSALAPSPNAAKKNAASPNQRAVLTNMASLPIRWRR